MALFKNKYRTEPARKPGYDYGSPGTYFVTVCTHKREHYFGEIIDQTMHLSELGRVVEQEWLKTPVLRPDMNLTLHPFVVMPNHFHALISIGKNRYNAPELNTPDYTNTDTTNHYGPRRKNLGSIMAGFKSAVTQYAKIHQIPFQWQPRFHDHIIRNKSEFFQVSWYIEHNIENWGRDRFYR